MRNFLFTILISCVFFACKKEIALDLRTASPLLVVEAELAEGSKATIKLTETRGFYTPNVFPPVTDASVSLASSTGETETLSVIGDSVFVSHAIEGKTNTVYYLSITYKEHLYTSQSTLYPAVPLDSVVARSVNPKMPPYFQIYWRDPLGKEIDYYRFRIFVNDTAEVKRNFAGSADIYDGEALSSAFVLSATGPNNEQIFKPGDYIRFDMLTVDVDAGNYFSFLGNNGKVNPPTNIKGGALGYFCAYSVSSKSVEVPQWEMQN